MSAAAGVTRPPLWTHGFRLLLVSTFLGWSAEAMIRTVLPLRILDLGGDAATVGIVALAFALPTLLLRPPIGRRIDRTGHGRIHRIGPAVAGAASLAFVVSGLLLVPFVRAVQGIGWACYGTANNVATARLAPPARRGEASGLFNLAYAVGFLAGPPLALALYAGPGAAATFLAAALLAFLALGVVDRLARVTPGARIEPLPGSSDVPAVAGPSTRGLRRIAGAWLEPAAVPLLVVAGLVLAGEALLLGFAAVWTRQAGLPDGWLALLFPVVGILNAVTQLAGGRLSDRVGRRRAVIAGIGIAAVGLGVAILPLGAPGYLAAAAVYAVASGLVVPAATAAAMDRAPEGRMGATLATYSMAHQLAAGIGGIAWGLLIASFGFPWPFIVALAGLGVALFAARRVLSPEAGVRG